MKKKRELKKALVVVFIIIIITGVVIGGIVYTTYFSQEESPAVSNSASSQSSVPSKPSRCSLVAQNDTYAKPDFDRLKSVMQEQPIVKDVPAKGLISLKFFHFAEGCRIYDKSYVLSDGQITESSGRGDIYVTLSSAYVDGIDENNFCDIVKQARSNGDLGQWIDDDVSESTLLWRYKSMLKYRECLGLKITG